ncbi:hypothetical protein N7468_005849 [Penicillium chermesinum]|uniref:Uncharacterized protein n=1 Tax=Penicillium chermesinum TaxID=63820 RepID=A0A9W9P029_9EURO|nr:uncharacterized protein N7468_005849 [Penicillium chermesinum]KAJ5232893.1 hypothetical protein N7468_005849 [Penicillium chermesinum]KAJ6172546.1 hypothetical protein N7470_001613 [Penicillium chermesinum]
MSLFSSPSTSSTEGTVLDSPHNNAHATSSNPQRAPFKFGSPSGSSQSFPIRVAPGQASETTRLSTDGPLPTEFKFSFKLHGPSQDIPHHPKAAVDPQQPPPDPSEEKPPLDTASQASDDCPTSESSTSDSEGEDNPSTSPRDELPEAPVYNPRLRHNLEIMKCHLLDMANTLRSSDLASDASTNLHMLEREARKLSEFRAPETWNVGFIGDSGVGKSSVINSLLDQPMLARSSRDGAACTCVVTEFRNIDADHPHPFTIEADFMNEAEVKELSDELVRSFRMFYCASLFREVTSTAEQEKLRETAGRAWETLNSLFGRYDKLDHEFLSDETEGADVVIQSTLAQWARDEMSRRPGGLNSLQYSVVTGDLEACKSQLDKLTSNESSDEHPVLWPFIKVIRVYLDSAILGMGLVIADLPGFRDLNYARVRSTERYLLHNCDEVFIVVGISRCTTDTSVQDIRTRCRGKTQRIVCTRSEDFDPEESARGSSNFRKSIAQINKDINKLSKSCSRRASDFRKAKSGKEGFAVELAEIGAQLSKLKLTRTEMLVNERNNRIGAELSAKHDGTTVFLVSNTLYSDHRDEQDDESEAYVRLSAIKDLRKHCQLVPAEAQMQATAAYLEHQVPALIGSLRQWILSGRDSVDTEKAKNLRVLLEGMERIVRRDLISPGAFVFRLKSNLWDMFDDQILQTIRRSKREWTSSCINISQEWATWNHASYAAFCRKNGTHETKNVKYRCWNDELIEIPREVLSQRWASVTNYLDSQMGAIKMTFSELFEQWINKLQERQNDAPHALDNLITSLDARKQWLVRELRNGIENILQHIETIMRDMLYGHDSSFIGELMRPAYNKCSCESGTGRHARQKAIMANHLQHSGLFSNYQDLTWSSYERIEEQFEVLEDKVVEQMECIIRDLHAVVVPEGKVSEAARAPMIAEELSLGLELTQRSLQASLSFLRDLKS